MALEITYGAYGSQAWYPLQNWGSESQTAYWRTQLWKDPPNGYACLVGNATNGQDHILPGASLDEAETDRHYFVTYGLAGNDQFAAPRLGRSSSIYLVGGEGRDEITGHLRSAKQANSHAYIVLIDSWREDLITDFDPTCNSIAIANNIFYDRQNNYMRLAPESMRRMGAHQDPHFFNLDRKKGRQILENAEGLYDYYRGFGDIVGILKARSFEEVESLKTKSWAQGIHLAWIGEGRDYELHFDLDGDWGTLDDQNMLAIVKTVKATPEPSLVFGFVETGQWERCPKRTNVRPIELLGK